LFQKFFSFQQNKPSPRALCTSTLQIAYSLQKKKISLMIFSNQIQNGLKLQKSPRSFIVSFQSLQQGQPYLNPQSAKTCISLDLKQSTANTSHSRNSRVV